MIIKSDIGNEQYLEIENLIKKGKYQDIIQFIKISISNQLQEEKNEVAKNNSIEGFEEKSKSGGMKETNNLLQESLDHLKLIETEDSDNKKKDVDFIWSFYNRFFPVKLAIVKLAQLITREEPYCNLDEWQEVATETGQEYKKILGEYEKEMEYGRNKKMSIGLPTHSSILEGITRKALKTRTEKKMNSSKNKFTNQFVGRYNTKEESLDGAPFVMDLISFKKSGNNFLISLTDLGKRLASAQNPILNDDYSKIFSNDEVKIIYEEIIPQFKIEKEIIQKIINDLKNKELTSKQCQSIFLDYQDEILKFSSNEPKKSDNEYIEKKITEARIGTMGRLSELKIVDWEIIKGESHYSLNKEKMNLLGL